MNRTVIQTGMFPETKIYGKYHLVTYCEDNGEDDKDYVNDMIIKKNIKVDDAKKSISSMK